MNNLFKICDVSVSEATFTTIINSEIAVALGILGISITIFTVVYSFIENKLEEKKKLERQIHIATKHDPYCRAELNFVRKYISRNIKLNKYFTTLVWISLIYILILVFNLFWRTLLVFILSQFFSLLYFLFFIVSIMYYVYRYSRRIQ